MKRNLIIKASAGTGKTFAIATRYLKLLIFAKAAPETILGLTFSRAAAQEIYEKILNRLRKAAASDKGASTEKATLLADADQIERNCAANVDWTPAMFAGILRRVIDAQYCDTIATLDSFILRIVQKFPLEMGFQKSLSVLDDYGKKHSVESAIHSVLVKPSNAGEFASDFATAQSDATKRLILGDLTDLGDPGKDWIKFLREHPEARVWTGESMRKALGIPFPLEKPDISILPVTGKKNDPFGTIVKRVEDWEKGEGEESKIFENNPGKLIKHLLENPGATSYAISASNVIDCGRMEVANVIRESAYYMMNAAIGRRLDVAAAKLRIAALFDDEYDSLTRKNGQLTFEDFTNCQAASASSEKAIQLENLQFRLDAQFAHWALDEFQDTSMAQWNCLKRLVEENIGPNAEGDRSVLAVGDLKQSIYTWRGGNDRPFIELEREMALADKDAIEEKPLSYRYGQYTANFVNAIFDPANIRGILGASCAEAIDKWESECWPKGGHKALTSADYVEVVSLAVGDAMSTSGEFSGGAGDEADACSAAMRKMGDGLCQRICDFWNARCAAGNHDSVGILVRKNGDGLYLAERLRKMNGNDGRPLPVIWEGESGVLDSPLSRGVLELLTLAEHPEDTFAWAVVDKIFPIREAVLPNERTPGEVSRTISTRLSRLGLGRTLREIVSALARRGLDRRTAMRLDELVREGVTFEARPDSAGGIAGFKDYLSNVKDREIASSPEVIRILTIHRAKGLTLGHVFVPVTSIKELDNDSGWLSGDGWLLEACNGNIALFYEKICKAREKAKNEHLLNELRTHYVAFTRAEKSTHVFIVKGSNNDKTLSSLIMAPFHMPEENVKDNWIPQPDEDAREQESEPEKSKILYSSGMSPDFANAANASVAGADGNSKTNRKQWSHEEPRVRIRHGTPSSEGATSLRARAIEVSRWFGVGSDARGDAMRRGIDEHAAYAAIEWVDPKAPKDEREREILLRGGDWVEAFVAQPGTIVWRERSYERFSEADNTWETGQFDRVVFRGQGTECMAIIYDFKTNAMRKGESAEQFVKRMNDEYAGQMSLYRKALASLCNIPEARITTKLLLTELAGAQPLG